MDNSDSDYGLPQKPRKKFDDIYQHRINPLSKRIPQSTSSLINNQKESQSKLTKQKDRQKKEYKPIVTSEEDSKQQEFENTINDGLNNSFFAAALEADDGQ